MHHLLAIEYQISVKSVYANNSYSGICEVASHVKCLRLAGKFRDELFSTIYNGFIKTRSFAENTILLLFTLFWLRQQTSLPLERLQYVTPYW